MMIQMMTIVYQTSMEHHVFARLAWNIMFVEGGTSCMLLWNHPPAGRQAVHEMKQEKHQRSKCLLHLEDDFSISEVVSLCGSTSPIVNGSPGVGNWCSTRVPHHGLWMRYDPPGMGLTRCFGDLTFLSHCSTSKRQLNSYNIYIFTIFFPDS